MEWQDIKTAANRIMKNNNYSLRTIDDVVGELYNNNLPSCIDIIARDLFVYPEKVHGSYERDINLILNAAKSLDKNGYIK